MTGKTLHNILVPFFFVTLAISAPPAGATGSDVIYPLREGLLEQGTTTLSLQMPVLANDAESKDYLPLFEESPKRIDAGIAYLHERKYSKITIVAHSMGAAMTTHYLAFTNANLVSSMVIIGMNPGVTGYRNPRALEKLRLPVLDLYGGGDLQGVLNFVEQRAAAGKAGANREFSQVRFDGANHFSRVMKPRCSVTLLSGLKRIKDNYQVTR